MSKFVVQKEVLCALNNFIGFPIDELQAKNVTIERDVKDLLR